ncbi:MAG: DUF6249 domain-containing protein [Gammaproteobacteria bacterium]|nr:DUF6249 domain-containing protein [Gammaproteobacteria bacterium]
MGFLTFLIAIAGIAMPVAILSIVFKHESKSETVQRMLESGQELNAEVLRGIPGHKKALPKDDRRNGINTLGTGIGLCLLGLVGLGDVIMGVGLLVACIGGAVLVNGHLNREQNKESSEK